MPNSFEEDVIILNSDKTENKDSIDDNPSPINEEPSSSKHIALTTEQLEKIKQDLALLIDAMNQNHSLISRAAVFWSEVPEWLKGIIGVVLVVPLVVLGIFASIALLVIGIVSALLYTSVSLLLDNHHTHNVSSTEGLKNGVNSLANMVGIVMQSLDRLREELNLEVSRFQLENVKLSENCQKLETCCNLMTETAKLFQAAAINEKFKEELNQRMESFLNNKEASFDQILTRFGKAEEQLQQANEKYETLVKQHQILLDKQEILYEKQEKQFNIRQQNMEAQVKVAPLINTFGIHQNEKKLNPPEQVFVPSTLN
jgi:hypothetical protein